ncbi:hypothetical protein C5167_002908 [Papaver somniferum]|uniref:Membrane insertase YidC/Oxa/ALB C-terminal domain-containing protein n=1 Tax=Papaver somniferum TaxID=3469 RepID=A0A4Y7L392_PAPSO|nr:hypothetical protein C5167_002908 [Papaver somniferum]
MAKSLIYSPFLSNSLPSVSRHHSSNHHIFPLSTTTPSRKFNRIKFSLQEIPPIHSVDFQAIYNRAGGLLYTLADAAVVAADSATTSVDASGSTDVAVQKSGGWFAFISDAMEVVLKVLKDGLTAVHVPYSYGFAIILLTVLVKAVTLPLTKQQVESTLAMQNLQPKIKAIQARYAGNQERIQLETSRLYKQAGVNPLAGCFPTLATIPVFIGLYQALSNDGHPPLGWSDTAAYLVLPVLLVASQFVSMEIMKPPQSDDPNMKNTQLIFKFLPLMIGYFSLSVPSGFTNNILSTAQQVWLRKLGGAKPAVSENASGIISAGQAKRSTSQPSRAGERFRQLKEEEKKKVNKALLSEDNQVLDSVSDADDVSDEETDSKDALEEALASSGSTQIPDYSGPKKSKRSKRKRTV